MLTFVQHLSYAVKFRLRRYEQEVVSIPESLSYAAPVESVI